MFYTLARPAILPLTLDAAAVSETVKAQPARTRRCTFSLVIRYGLFYVGSIVWFVLLGGMSHLLRMGHWQLPIRRPLDHVAHILVTVWKVASTPPRAVACPSVELAEKFVAVGYLIQSLTMCYSLVQHAVV